MQLLRKPADPQHIDTGSQYQEQHQGWQLDTKSNIFTVELKCIRELRLKHATQTSSIAADTNDRQTQSSQYLQFQVQYL